MDTRAVVTTGTCLSTVWQSQLLHLQPSESFVRIAQRVVGATVMTAMTVDRQVPVVKTSVLSTLACLKGPMAQFSYFDRLNLNEHSFTPFP